MTTALKVSLADIKPLNWMSPKPVGWHSLLLCHIESFEICDSIPTGDKHDEVSVNECAKRARFDADKYLVVVVNHEGKAMAIYRDGEKIA